MEGALAYPPIVLYSKLLLLLVLVFDALDVLHIYYLWWSLFIGMRRSSGIPFPWLELLNCALVPINAG